METAGDISPSEKEALAKEFRDIEEIRTREAKSRAVVLEILGDIPDADITPPKNVLFVCKLNPVTEEDDLKIIFSRFGTVKKCDIIKDYVTGDSLQYAFIEFETEDSCNEAYFKMQNVLIDDRRIHVDFCQSVSGFWKRYYHKENFTRKSKDNSDHHKSDHHSHNTKRDDTHHHKSYHKHESDNHKHRKHESDKHKHHKYESDRRYKHEIDRDNHNSDRHRSHGRRDSDRKREHRSSRDGRSRRRSLDSDGSSHRHRSRSRRHKSRHRSKRTRSRSRSIDSFGRSKDNRSKYVRRSISRGSRSRSRDGSADRYRGRRSYS